MAPALRYATSATYQRHQPETETLYRTMQSYWPVFVREQSRVGKTIPKFIHDEFQKFLDCGILENGFVRTYCYNCQHSGVVAFSCKKRGFCPSCCARRMNDEAAHIVDKVLPPVAYRQFVISYPYKLRFLMAYNPGLTNKILKIFIKAIESYQRIKAKRAGVHCKVKSGSITVVQRFGSALNLNIHFHTLVADGVFYKSGNSYEFYRLSEPTKEELFAIAEKVKTKVEKLIQAMGLDEQDQLDFDENLLAELSQLSITQKAAFDERAGRKLKRYGTRRIEIDVDDKDPYTANVEGFSLNGRVVIPSNDRKKLEKLIRYMARGPIATERLTESFSNTLLYKMKTPWKDGTTHVSFSPLDFIARLVALIPPPRVNMIRYHGVFAPNFKARQEIVPQKKPPIQNCADINPLASSKRRRERMRWAEMLKRTFEIDVTVCPKCQGRLEQIAIIKDKKVARAVLESMELITIYQPMKCINDRGPPTGNDLAEDFDQRESW